MKRIGIDVGGTHTDAVLLDGDEVVAHCKALTSHDVMGGVLAALQMLQEQAGAFGDVAAVMIGTTQFTNAVVERKGLARIAAIRLGLPAGRGMPPGSGWPDDMHARLATDVFMLPGGHLYDGKPLSPLDPAAMVAVADAIIARGIADVAIAAAFSPANPDAEQAMAQLLLARNPELRLTLSHRVGRIGLLERENAAMLNAALKPLAQRVVDGFADALARFGLTCPLYISQNDGTLMDASFVRAFPALTFSSGPTNSLRGAARLTGVEDAIVVDIGGTTSDVGVLRGGFPRESNRAVDVGGVRTNFRMPDVNAIGLGGGSLVHDEGRRIGPQSVGHRLVTEALVFGGKTLTATDLIVAAGRADIGDRSLVAHLPAKVVDAGLATIARMLDDAIRRMKPDRQPLPVILVGGGALLAPDRLANAERVLRPAQAGVANAIGAAIALIGGESEIMASLADEPREAALARATAGARAIAVQAGADPATIRTTDIEETPIPYMDGGALRIRVRVVGDIAGLGANGKASA